MVPPIHIPLIDKGFFLLSVIIATGIGVHVARGIHRAGVEHFAGRILMHSAIINTAGVALMLLLLGGTALPHVLTPAGFHMANLVVTVLLLILPVRAGWNYIKASSKVMGRFGLLPPKRDNSQMEVSAAARAMGVSAPIILSSPQYQIPFVFGRNSSQVCLAIPDAWSSMDANSRYVMLLHELAHIRNQDVGFLTWSFAFLNDLRWALLSSPIVIVLSLWGGQEHLSRAAVLYVAYLLILWFTTNTVLKSRELLADATIAMLIDSRQIVRTFEDILEAPVTGLHLGGSDSPGLILRWRSWLADKAMFSGHATIWRVLARSVEWSLETHPSIATRRSAICSRRAARESSPVRNEEAFWAGLTLGLLSTLIALGGFWTGKFVLGWQDDECIIGLSYNCGGTVAPLVIVFIALFFVLPAWSSLHPHVPTGRNFARLLSRYLYGALGACCVLPLILLGGWSHPGIRLLAILAVLWVFIILAMGTALSIIMLSLWLSLRYKRRHFFIDLAWFLYSYGVGLLAISCYFVCGLVMLSNDQAIAGGSVSCGLLIGLAIWHMTTRNSFISGTDQYMVIALQPVFIALEGGTYRYLSPIVGSLYCIVSCMVPAAITSVIIHVVGHWTLGEVDRLLAMVILAFFGCSIFLFLDWQWPRRVREPCRQKICSLLKSQTLLQHRFSIESRRVINRILECLQSQYGGSNGFGKMTTARMFELTGLVPPDEWLVHPIREQVRHWAYACEIEGGFGVWPGSEPRLSSTYQCLLLLQETGGIRLSDPNRHITWIRKLQTPDGCFRGPWSYRPQWEDTFFATAALSLLSSALDEEARVRCLTWLKKVLVQEGITKGQLDAFHYCLSSANALCRFDEEIIRTAGTWLSAELDRLLLTHVGHNAENIRHAVCACQIFKEHGISLVSQDRTALLADRINDALNAELTGLRI